MRVKKWVTTLTTSHYTCDIVELLSHDRDASLFLDVTFCEIVHLKKLMHKDNQQIMGANQNMQDGWTKITADWLGELAFLGTNQDGATVQMGGLDGEPALGPMQLILTGLAGCTGMDIVSILKKKRVDIEKFQVKIQGKRAAEHPRVYTEIEIQYLLWGSSLDEKSVEQAIQLSEEKYCSASAMLGAVAQIKSSYQLFETSKA